MHTFTATRTHTHANHAKHARVLLGIRHTRTQAHASAECHSRNTSAGRSPHVPVHTMPANKSGTAGPPRGNYWQKRPLTARSGSAARRVSGESEADDTRGHLMTISRARTKRLGDFPVAVAPAIGAMCARWRRAQRGRARPSESAPVVSGATGAVATNRAICGWKLFQIRVGCVHLRRCLRAGSFDLYHQANPEVH